MDHGPHTYQLLCRLQDGDPILGISVLNISGLNITSLPDLPDHITILNCYGTPLNKLPKLPKGLITLVCSNTPLLELPELPDTLRYLDCSNTNIVILPDIPNNLIYLDCAGAPLYIQRNTNEDITSYKSRLKEERESKHRCIHRSYILKDELIALSMSPLRIADLYNNYGSKALEVFYIS